jgi:hypothetical protein
MRTGPLFPARGRLRRCDEGVRRGIFIGGGDDQRGPALGPFGDEELFHLSRRYFSGLYPGFL